MAELIDRFEILELLGEGAVSWVYKAHDPGTGRKVAIKLLKDINSLPDFVKECQTFGKLTHHNIVTIYDVGEHDSQPFIAMELLEGQFLDVALQSGIRFSWNKVTQIAKQLGLALEYAHNMGIVHGDIKPGNIVYEHHSGKVILTDFATQEHQNICDTMTLKAEQVNAATPYLPPERLIGNGSDKRSDLYSLGVVLYQLLTGERPFDSDNFQELATQITQREHKAISISETQAPVELVKVIDRLMNKDPEGRYQNAAAFLLELAHVPDDVVLPTPKTNRNTFALAAAAVAGICTAAIIWTVIKDPSVPVPSTKPDTAKSMITTAPSPIKATTLATKQSLSTLQATINKRLTKFECASLHAEVDNANEVNIRGHVSLEDDMMSLMDLMDGFPGVNSVTYEVNALKWPFCEAISILSADTRTNISNTDGLQVASIIKPREVTTDNQLNFEVTAPNYDSYLYVDFYRTDGSVVHMYPRSADNASITLASARFTVEEKLQDSSLGESLVVVMATYNPILDTARPKVEKAQQYLSEIHRQVVVNRVEMSANYLLVEKIPVSDM